MPSTRSPYPQEFPGRCNPGRRHSALGYLSPIDYERRAADALETQSP